MENHFGERVILILSQALGEFVATAMVKRNCEAMGANPSALTSEQLPQLLERTEKSIAFFIDKDRSRVVIERLRALVES
jgi:tripartite-type tricarboxylate transporter receptor subunit TctC